MSENHDDSCPFCGEAEDLDVQYGAPDREGIPVNIICGSCGACGPWDYAPTKDLAECVAKKLWRERKPLTT